MFLLGALPFLQEYGNISYHSSDTASDREGGSGSEAGSDSSSHLAGNVLIEFEKYHDKRSRSQMKKLDSLKPVVPIVSIEMPD